MSASQEQTLSGRGARVYTFTCVHDNIPYRLPYESYEAIWIRKTDNMNRDEGSYQLSHVWDKLLHTDDWHRKSALMKASDVKPKRR